MCTMVWYLTLIGHLVTTRIASYILTIDTSRTGPEIGTIERLGLGPASGASPCLTRTI